jgi:hypothetical protein
VLKTELQAALDEAGGPRLEKLASIITKASAQARFDTLIDRDFRAELAAKMKTPEATCVTGLLMEGTLEWSSQPNLFTHLFVAHRQPQPMPPNGTGNCWEFIMYAGYMSGRLKADDIFELYRSAIESDDPNQAFYDKMGYREDLPSFPETKPKAGQLLYLTNKEEPARKHIVLSLGGDQVLSLWRFPREGVCRLSDVRQLGDEFRIQVADAPWEVNRK